MSEIKALAFDVGGSVFDWKAAVKAVVNKKIAKYDLNIDAEELAMSWRLTMFMYLGKLHRGEIRYCNMDVMLKMALDELLGKRPELPFDAADKADLMQAWHQMEVWDEFPEALKRMKSKFKVTVLSVLSFAILVDSSKHAGITWDALMSCEFLSCYKQKPEAYNEGAQLLGLKNEEICFVAVHPSDILSAKKTGMKTAYVAPKASEPDVPGLVM
jgi:2-haloacid dehalogenase